MNILLIEDNQDLSANVGEFLESRSCVVDYAMDGLTGLHLAAVNRYDVVILDLNLPGMDGVSLCKRLRQDAGSTVPILMLTARNTEYDKLAGFKVGADDYQTKPFSLLELHARLQALSRRSSGVSETLQVADLVFDMRSLVARRGKRRLALTRAGLKLLEVLMRASPGVVSRAQVESAIWGEEPPESDAALRAHIHILRKTVDQGATQKLLHTLHGVGYQLAIDEKA